MLLNIEHYLHFAPAGMKAEFKKKKFFQKLSLSFLSTALLIAPVFSISLFAQTISNNSGIYSVIKNGKLIIRTDSTELLTYNFETVFPPAGIDSGYKRSGFIHPLQTPHGQILTRIQPPDHYHHYGIWNPWTHVLFEGDTVDFWNLNAEQGTVRFAKFIEKRNEDNFSEYSTLHEHVVFHKDGTEKVALNEIQTVRVFKPENNRYSVDLNFEYKCAGQSPFKILEYRYAGLGWRATGEWNDTNSFVSTSEGKTRIDADGTRARWFIVQGKLGNDYGGILMMSNPENYNYPEPVRIWPVGMNGRGDVFANFCPTKNTDWLLEPAKTYTLKYRFIVFNGHFTSEMAENEWKKYVNQKH